VIETLEKLACKLSQSPQTGQFNSYIKSASDLISLAESSLNPLKRVNSILTVELSSLPELTELRSQSPQTGQFNSYRVWDTPSNSRF